MKGQEFTARRKALKLSQEAAGRALGVSRQAVNAWEGNTAPISQATAMATWALEERRAIEALLAPLIVGEMRIGEKRNPVEDVDQTQEWIARLRARLDDLDRIIAEYRV